MSLHTGLLFGFNVVTEIMYSSESVSHDPGIDVSTPADFEMPADGLSLRSPDTALAQEERLHKFKIPAAFAFARANRLDHVVFGTSEARIGIVTVGKAHADRSEEHTSELQSLMRHSYTDFGLKKKKMHTTK